MLFKRNIVVVLHLKCIAHARSKHWSNNAGQMLYISNLWSLSIYRWLSICSMWRTRTVCSYASFSPCMNSPSGALDETEVATAVGILAIRTWLSACKSAACLHDPVLKCTGSVTWMWILKHLRQGYSKWHSYRQCQCDSPEDLSVSTS